MLVEPHKPITATLLRISAPRLKSLTFSKNKTTRALVIRIGFWGILHYTFHQEPVIFRPRNTTPPPQLFQPAWMQETFKKAKGYLLHYCRTVEQVLLM